MNALHAPLADMGVTAGTMPALCRISVPDWINWMNRRGVASLLGAVSWFRSSRHWRYHARGELRNQNDTAINKLLVSFRFRNSPKTDIDIMRISESGQ